MVPATALSPAKVLVVRAFDATGNREATAARAGVGPTRAGQWVDPNHTALPNVAHMLAVSTFGRLLAQGVIDHHDATEPVVVLNESGLRREAIRLNMRAAGLLERLDGTIASGDVAAMAELRQQLHLLGEQVRRIERSLRAGQGEVSR